MRFDFTKRQAPAVITALDPAITRDDASALIPEEVQREIVQGVPEASATLRLFTRLPNMARAQRRLPVLETLPHAYFVNGDIGQKKTTNQKWANKFIDAEEIAVIVPIPQAVVDDVDYDIWAEIMPRIVEAFGIKIDEAILWGTNAPASWPTDILRGCYYSMNTIVDGTNTDLVGDISDTGGVMALVEADGFDVNGHIAEIQMKAKLRGLRDNEGRHIYNPSMTAGTPSVLYGAPIGYVKNGSWDSSQGTTGQEGLTGGANLISGDFRQAVFAIRQDITTKVLTEAVIQDDDQSILYNLAQQDMVALRVVMRLGWQVPNPINRLRPTEVDWATPVQGEHRYPFAALVPVGTP